MRIVLLLGLVWLSPCFAGDSLDTNLTLLVSLDKVERALFCGDDEAILMRNQILRTIGEIERCGFDRAKDRLFRLTDWANPGIRGGACGQEFAYARLLKAAGVLYGFPEYESRGRRIEGRLVAANGTVPGFRDESAVPEKVRDYYRLMDESRDDLVHLVRPGDGNGGCFWNANARMFLYPPSFDFKPVAGAAKYVFRVTDDIHQVHEFSADRPTASLGPVWAGLPVGFVTVACRAQDAAGKDLGCVGERRFWRSAPFDPAQYRPARRTYAEARRLALDHLFSWPEIGSLEKCGAPDVSQGSNFTSYPSKMQSAVIRTMLAVAQEFPERRERALKIARISADYLLGTREPAGSPLEGFTATYVGTGQLSGRYSGQHMLVYPAASGGAFLALYRVTNDRKYLDAAVRIGNSYLRLQGKDGTWFLKMNAKDGSPVSPNRLVPTSVMTFLDELYDATSDARFREAGDRAFASIDRGPLVDWDWEGQFEDIAPAERRYQNLTKHMPCETALYMLKRFPGDVRRLAQARDILRFAEDQFVVWRTPCRPDGTGAWTPDYQFFTWRTPAALEQYNCYLPIDASAVKLIKTYLAVYRAEGRSLDLAKARALGDAIVNNQDDSGRIRTYWIPETEDKDDPLAGAAPLPLGGDWYNCMAADVEALEELIGACARAENP